MSKFVTKIALVLCVVFGMAVSVSAEEAKAETKKVNAYGSKAQNGWLKDFEYSDDYCWHKIVIGFKYPKGENQIGHCKEYLKEEIKLLIPYAEKKDGKKCNIDMDDERGSGKSDGIYCGRLKSVLSSLNDKYGNHTNSAGNKIIEIEYKLLR